VLVIYFMLCYWLNVLPFYASYIEPWKACAFVAVFCLFVYRTSLFVNHRVMWDWKLQIFVWWDLIDIASFIQLLGDSMCMMMNNIVLADEYSNMFLGKILKCIFEFQLIFLSWTLLASSVHLPHFGINLHKKVDFWINWLLTVWKHFQKMHPNRNSFAYASGPAGILIPIFFGLTSVCIYCLFLRFW